MSPGLPGSRIHEGALKLGRHRGELATGGQQESRATPERNELGVVHASYQFALFVHLFGDAQLIENTDKEHPAYPSALGVGIGGALYIEQQALQCFSRSRIGLRGIVPHPDD